MGIIITPLRAGTVTVACTPTMFNGLMLCCQAANLPEYIRDKVLVLQAADRGTEIEGYGRSCHTGQFILDFVELAHNVNGIGWFKVDEGDTIRYFFSTPVVPNQEPL